MKITPIGRVFTDKGWDSYSLIELEPHDIEASRASGSGEADYTSRWLVDQAAAEGCDANPMLIGMHPRLSRTYIAAAEVRIPSPA